MSEEQTGCTLWCIIKGHPIASQFRVAESINVNHFKKNIKEKLGIRVNVTHMILWKLRNPEPVDPENTLKDRIEKLGTNLEEFAIWLSSSENVLELFPDPPTSKHVHIIVEILSKSDDKVKEKHIIPPLFKRTWAINGAITEKQANERYYVNPGSQKETECCLNAVSNGTYLLLTGSRASGKSTRLFWLQQQLTEMGYWVLYVSFDYIYYRGSTKEFWESFGREIYRAAARCGRGLEPPKGPTMPISSRAQFIHYFRKDSWDGKVVLLLDEFTCLYQAEDNVRDDCLRAFRGLGQIPEDHAVQCLIAAGTFSIAYLYPSIGHSPFSIGDLVQCPYFTIDETRELFREFAHDLGFSIDDAIIEDVWAKSNGHPGMVCLCGRTIFNNIQTLICPESWTISYNLWQQFPAARLYDAISRYNDTFHSMIESLSRAEAFSCLNLLRSRFAGFLGDVTLTDMAVIKDANTLTSEGVLLRPNRHMACYRMASPLVDGLIRNQLIPAKFPNAPSSCLPLHPTGDADVLSILVESLKFFDKALILIASFCSHKTPKVKIPLSHGRYVPRESVYDTELMRILANWLRKYDWSVNSQWRLEDDSKSQKYSDIVLKKDNRTIVLELLATGDPNSIESRIQKTPEYAALLSANEAWVVHFTRQENYDPIWQPNGSPLNIVHFAHNAEFTKVVMSARWNCAGEIRQEIGRALVLD